jgi:hypothetical protein
MEGRTMNSTLRYTTSTEGHRRAVEDRRRRAESASHRAGEPHDLQGGRRPLPGRAPHRRRQVHRVRIGRGPLDAVAGTTDLSSIGESATYPTGYGCEVCA